MSEIERCGKCGSDCIVKMHHCSEPLGRPPSITRINALVRKYNGRDFNKDNLAVSHDYEFINRIIELAPTHKVNYD